MLTPPSASKRLLATKYYAEWLWIGWVPRPDTGRSWVGRWSWENGYLVAEFSNLPFSNQ